MRTINVKPVEIVGYCRAQLTPDDEFQIDGTRLKNPGQHNCCLLALSHFGPVVSRLQKGNRFYAHVCCPDCLAHLGQSNHVVFLLGHADKWELCQAISEYRRLCRQCGEEPEPARHLRVAAGQYQERGEYDAAAEQMRLALAELKQMAVV
jgi:uncharacterized repeat protein (TIGR04076 family)